MFNLLELPKQIDALVLGIIQFAYGVAGAWGLVMLRPVRGSLYLARVAKVPISSYVALLLAVSLCGLSGGAYDNYLYPLARAATGAGVKDLWRFLTSTLVYFLVLDGLSHLLGGIGARHGRRRVRAVAMCRYAFAASAATLGLGGVLTNAIVMDIPRGPTENIEGWLQIGEFVVAFTISALMAISTTLPLRVGTAVARRRLPSGFLAIPLYYIPGCLLIATLYLAFGAWAYVIGGPNAVPTIGQAYCERSSENSIVANFVINNWTTESFTYVPKQVELDIEGAGLMEPVGMVGDPFLTVKAGETTTAKVRFRALPSGVIGLAKARECIVSGEGLGVDRAKGPIIPEDSAYVDTAAPVQPANPNR